MFPDWIPRVREPELLLVQQGVQIPNQFHITVEVFFFRDPLAKNVHPFSFIRFHVTNPQEDTCENYRA